MVSAIVMAIIAGLFCTLFFNTHFIRFFIKDLRTPPEKRNPLLICGLKKKDVGFVLVIQLVAFLFGFAVLALWYYLSNADRTFSELLATAWVIGIIHLSNWAFITDAIYLEKATSKSFDMSAIIFGFGIIVISLLLNISSGIYTYYNQEDAHTYLQDETIPVVSTDVIQTLQNEMVIEGYELKTAINRNGTVIIPMAKKSGNTSFAGYIVIEEDEPTIVRKELRYTPYHDSSTQSSLIARKNMPTKIFFGNWSFQLSPDGDVYFACMYGKHAWLRGGRNVEGVALVNAETGEFTTYLLDSIPTWISGISE